MKKSLLIACLAIVAFVALTMPTYAAVQNIKLSGDLLMRGITRNDFDLSGHGGEAINRGTWNSATQNYFMTTTRVRLDADLTDNVAATVRLLNERKWGNTATSSNPGAGNSVNNVQAGNPEADDDIRLDLAYATLKEFLYAPLTLTIGRQRMQFGNGMIIGDPDTNLAATSGESINPVGTAMQSPANMRYYTPAPDLSEQKSFDAIRATINLAPWTFDAVYSKTDEADQALNDDQTLWGLNTGYQFDFKNTLGEMYYFSKSRGKAYTAIAGAGNAAAHPIDKNDEVFTFGSRISTDPWENFNVQVEAAFQLGRYNPLLDPNNSGANNVTGIKRRAWASELSASYNFAKMKYTPKLTGVYAFFSGEPKAINSRTTTLETYSGWDPMFENQSFGEIANALFRHSNMHIWGLKGSLNPLQDITLYASYYYYNLNRGYNRGDRVILNGLFNGRQYVMNSHDHLGQEIDLNVTYDYTEDVQFGLLGGLFVPGNAFMNGDEGQQFLTNHKIAKEVIGSMKVTF